MEGYVKGSKEKSIKKKWYMDKKLFSHIDKKIIFTFFSFLLTLLTIKDNALMCVIPVLAVGFLLDFSYLIFAIFANFIGCLVLGGNYIIAYAIMLFTFCFFAFISQIINVKTYIRIGCAVFVSEIISRGIYLVGNNQAITSQIIIYPIISLGIYSLGIHLLEIFSHHKNERISQGCAISIAIFTLLSILGLSNIIKNEIVINILLHLSLLIISRFYGLSLLTYISLFWGSVLLYFQDRSIMEITIFCIPFLISYLIGRNGKYQALISYLLAYLCLGLLQKDGIIIYHFLIISLSVSFIYSMIPSMLIENYKIYILNIETFEQENLKHVKKLENEIVNRLNKFSRLFEIISKEYQSDETYKLKRKQISTIFNNLCINCPKNKQCYQEEENKNIALFLKSISYDLNNKDIDRINKNCLKPSRFLELSASLKNNFYLEYQYDQQYKNLKKAISFQIQGFKDVLGEYINKVKIEQLPTMNYKEKIIKDTLESLNLDVLLVRVHQEEDGKSSFILDIKLDTTEDIYQLIIPSLEDSLGCSLKLESFSEVLLEPYYSLRIREYEAYEFIMGVSQRSKESQIIGDSYINFNNANSQIFAISDGMGVGEEAREESKATIKLLKEILETGMDVKNTILMINSLLKMKNRYDSYATLDLVNINKKTLKANFSKNGSPFSYLYREGELIKIDPSALPIGIVDDIDVYDCCINLKPSDCIIMFSDGISGEEAKMKDIIDRCVNYHPQVLAKEIIDGFLGKHISDDTTVMVIRVKKTK